MMKMQVMGVGVKSAGFGVRRSGIRWLSSTVPSWATLDPKRLGPDHVCELENYVGGKWKKTKNSVDIVDPMTGDVFMKMPDTTLEETEEMIAELRKVPKSGLHNAFKSPERYRMYGDICHKVAAEMHKPEVLEFFVDCIQRTVPKSRVQATNEVTVSRQFIETFAGDAVRFMARGFTVAGDHAGQESRGYRWPYGPVALVAPFNFPLEIPLLQLMGALFMGNKPIVKGPPQASMVIEQYIRLLLHCGMPKEDLILLHGGGEPMQKVILDTPVKVTQFTGSSAVGDKLLEATKGKVKVEDAGFDWKIIGPDVVGDKLLDYVAYVCDQDAYACSGQKCSAQSALFVHSNAVKGNLLGRLESLAARRSIDDLTIGPVLTWTTEKMLAHKDKVLGIKGAKLLWGGKALNCEKAQKIPKIYGAIEPTAVSVPITELLASDEAFNIATTELFGPFQIIVEYNDNQLDLVLEACERMSHHLTAAVVSTSADFVHHIVSNTVNGTTYAGIRGRTTGAPSNHWFGPAGNPNGAGIGTPEAIRLVWSCHREVISDVLMPPSDWELPNRPT